MKINFYKTDLGIICQNELGYVLKSTYNKKIISKIDFENSNPIKINKITYLTELNKYFKNKKFEWEHQGTKFKKGDNLETVKEFNSLPKHKVGFYTQAIIGLYQGKIYYFCYYYFPRLHLLDLKTKEFLNKWTHYKNVSPIFNKDTKQFI